MSDAAVAEPIAVIPQPVSMAATDGDFVLPAALGIWSDFETGAAGAWLSATISQLTGASFDSPDGRGMDVQIAVEPRKLPEGVRKPEGYTLTVTPTGVRIVGFDQSGALYGCVTLTQLLRETENGWVFTGVEIADAPRFQHRGAMLDIVRHYFGPDDIRAFIDRLVALKLNRLHLHLSDDQGWRIQIDSWPDLTAKASATASLGDPGGFLTKQEYADVVAYASDRGITIIPEIDLPGHTHAIGVAYPQFVSEPVVSAEILEQAETLGQALPVHGQPYLGWSVGHSSVRFDDDTVYAFLEDVLREVAELTPGPHLHIGGDEALGTSAEDFAEFLAHVSAYVVSLGKTPIAWHEAGAADDLARGTIGQYWNLLTADGASDHVSTARAFVERGGKVIVSPADAIYLDMKETRASPLGLTWAGTSSLERAYNWDPATLLGGVDESDILGVEAPLWTETLRTLADIDAQVFPRILAAAEIAWSPQGARDWSAFQTRVLTNADALRKRGFGIRSEHLITTETEK